MKINETKIRNLIRKKILEQISGEADDVDNDGVPDGIDRDVPEQNKDMSSLEEDTEATAALKKELLSQAKLLEKGCKPGVGLSKNMNRKKARELSDRLYEATEGAGDGVITGAVASLTMGLVSGIGTNEAEVQAVFSDSAIECLADLSYVAYMYEKNYPGYTIASTLAGEYGYFSSTEFRKNIRDPLEDLLSDSPIFILGDTKYDAGKIAQMKSDAEKFISDSQEFVSRSGGERALDAGKGVAAAAATLGTIGAIGGLAGAIKATGLAGGGLLSALGSGFVGGVTAGSVGTSGAAIGTAAVTGTAAGTGGFIPVVGPALIMAPGPGWVTLGVLAVGSALFMAFDEADFSLQEETMLSPDLYIGLNKQFKTASEDLRKEAEKAFIPSPAPEPSEIQEEETTYPPLPADINGLSNNKTECTRRYQAVMNAYSDSRDLGYPNIKVDGKEGPETRGMWSKFVRHVFETHSTFSTLEIASVVASGQVSKWQDISSSLVSTYPGYTKSPCGCLAFSLDAYYNNVYFGPKQPGKEINVVPVPGPDRSGVKSGGQSRKDRSDRSLKDLDLPNNRSGVYGANDIMIGVDFNNENIENTITGVTQRNRLKNASKLKDVFPTFNTRLTQRLIDNMKEYDVFSGRDGRTVDTDTVYELQVDIKRNGKAKIKKSKESKTFGNRSGRNFGKLAKTVEQVMNDEFNENARAVFDKLRMQIRLKAGRYALNENQLVRKLIRQAIIKQIIK